MSQVTKDLFLISSINWNQRPTKYESSPSVSVYHATQAKIILYINSSLPQEVYVQSQKGLCCSRCRLRENTTNLGKETKFSISICTWQCKAVIFSILQTFSSQDVWFTSVPEPLQFSAQEIKVKVGMVLVIPWARKRMSELTRNYPKLQIK